MPNQQTPTQTDGAAANGPWPRAVYSDMVELFTRTNTATSDLSLLKNAKNEQFGGTVYVNGNSAGVGGSNWGEVKYNADFTREAGMAQLVGTSGAGQFGIVIPANANQCIITGRVSLAANDAEAPFNFAWQWQLVRIRLGVEYVIAVDRGLLTDTTPQDNISCISPYSLGSGDFVKLKVYCSRAFYFPGNNPFDNWLSIHSFQAPG